jgi:hypothetical protein
MNALDKPIWHTLTGPQAGFADVHDGAARYHSGVATCHAVTKYDTLDICSTESATDQKVRGSSPFGRARFRRCRSPDRQQRSKALATPRRIGLILRIAPSSG